MREYFIHTDTSIRKISAPNIIEAIREFKLSDGSEIKAAIETEFMSIIEDIVKDDY